MKNIALTLLCAGVLATSLAQETGLVDSLNYRLDSLKMAHQKTHAEPTIADTLIVHVLNRLSEAYWTSDPALAIDYARETLLLSEEIGYEIGIASAYHSMATVSINVGDFDQAITFFGKSLSIRKAEGSPKNIAASELNLGQVYWKIGDYAEAMRLYISALKRYESIDDNGDETSNIAGCHLNIGIVLAVQGRSEEALKAFEKALDLFKKMGNKYGEAYAYGNMGTVSTDLNQLEKALYYDSLSFRLKQELNDKMGMANGHNNLAYDFEQLGNDAEALKNYTKALEITREIGDQSNETLTWMNIGSLYARQGKHARALESYKKSLDISLAIGSYPDIADIYQQLANLDSAMGNYQQALSHYKKYIAARDTVFNQDQTKKLTQVEMQYTFDKKVTATRRAQEEKDAIVAREAQKQRWIRNSFMGGFAVVLVFSIVFFTQRNTIKQGKKLSDDLLLNILPSEIATELKTKGKSEAKHFDEVTVLFTDFKNFTALSEKLSPKQLVGEINYCYSAFDKIIGKHRIEKIKTIGDSYMCAGGLPVINKTNAVDTVRVALEIRDFMLAEKAKREARGETYFEIRIGCNTGSVVAGIVGIKKYAYDIWGDTVNTASRMESSGEPGQVNISGSTYGLVKDSFVCTYRGKIQAKGKGEVDMYFVDDLRLNS